MLVFFMTLHRCYLLLQIVVCAKAVNDTTTPAKNENADLNFLFMSSIKFYLNNNCAKL